MKSIRHRYKIQKLPLGTSYMAYCPNCGTEGEWAPYKEQARYNLKEKFKKLKRKGLICKDLIRTNS